MTIETLTKQFVAAAVQLGDHMLADLQRDPNFAHQVARAVESGMTLTVALVLTDPPAVELSARDDYGAVKRISSITAR